MRVRIPTVRNAGALPGAFRHACLVALLVPPALLAGQERVSVSGRVVDAVTRQGIPGVYVDLPELDIHLQADSAGVFELRDAPVGKFRLHLHAAGYLDAAGDFAILRPGSFVTSLQPVDAVASAANQGRLVGRVSSAAGGGPMEGVRVRMDDVALDGLTGRDGRFVFGSVPPGTHVVEFSQLGYATRHDTVEVRGGETSDVRVDMAVDPLELDPIDVTVERRDLLLEARGFYERRRVTSGDFIDRERIQEWKPVQMTDIFRRMRGVSIRLQDPANPLTRSVILTRAVGGTLGNGGLCYPSVFLDGVIAHRGGGDPAMLDQLLDPDKIAGIEVYHGGASVPAEYGGAAAACGVIVIWTGR